MKSVLPPLANGIALMCLKSIVPNTKQKCPQPLQIEIPYINAYSQP
jgi:hypothetical protein